MQLNPAGELGQHFVFRGRHQNHFCIQALGQVQIDARRVTGGARGHHAFNNQHVFANGGLLIKADNLFEQLIELAVAEHALNVGQAQGLWRLEAVGTRHQFGRAFRPGVAGVRLGNGLEKADFQACTLQSTNQAEAD